MQTVDYDIVGSYNNQRVTSIDGERSVNLFEYIDPLAKKPKVLINTSGLVNQDITFTGATGGTRAQFVFGDSQYIVLGSLIFQISTSGLVSQIGTIGTTSGFVGVDANTFQIIFVDGQHGYIWDTTAGTFNQITDKAFPTTPIDVCMLDGFFVVAVGGTPNFQLSSLNQGMVWGPAANNFTTNFAVNSNLTIGASTIGGVSGTANYATGVPVTVSSTGNVPSPLVAGTTYYSILVDATNIKLATSYANAIAGTFITLTNNGTGTLTITSLGQLQQGSISTHPGNIVACRTLHRRLFLFSLNFTEVWENAGIGFNLPFRRNNSLLIEYGTPAIGSVSVGFDKLIFLSQDKDGLGPVQMTTGTEVFPVSNRALDFQLSQYAALNQVSDCRGFFIRENGILFYRMNFTAANHTFVYNVSFSNPADESERRWHEEELLDGTRHPANAHAYINGNNYVGHFSKPILYILDPFTYTNDGENIRRMRIARPFVPPGYQRIRVDRFQIDLIQGNNSVLQPTFVDLDLLTETTGEFLTTEDDNPILLEQQLEEFNPNDLFVFLSLSKDGGQTFGNMLKAPMGAIGQRSFRTLWRKLGTVPRGQAFVPKIEFFQNAAFVLMGASWAYEVMPE